MIERNRFFLFVLQAEIITFERHFFLIMLAEYFEFIFLHVTLLSIIVI